MKVNVQLGNITETDADALIVNLFEGVTTPGGATGAVDRALDGAISEMIAFGDITGKSGEATVLYPRGKITARRIIVVGLGKQSEFSIEEVRLAASKAMKRAQSLKVEHIATIVHGGGIGGIPIGAAAQATVEGSLLASYKFTSNNDKKNETSNNPGLILIEIDKGKIEQIEKGINTAEAIVRGVFLTRDLVNMPPNIATPTKMSTVAEEIAASHQMNLMIGDREWAADKRMGAYLAVAKGAGEPPKFVILEHNIDRNDLATVVLVGKGITFDTGGISLKPVAKMDEMKSDMAGAAVVLGVMQVVGELDLPLRVIGIAPCTENMPDAHAYRPADVITASNGKRIEIISTDAEGRMVLADALVYADRYHPDAVIDLATLTGSCVIALGKGIAAGLFTNDGTLGARLEASGEATSERVWPLPLWEDYKDAIKSDVADVKNTGGRFGGVGTSAIFLKEFTNYQWAHLDIAGMALGDKEKGYTPKGATGFGVRLLIDLLQNW